MKATLEHGGLKFCCDLSQPHDISIPLTDSEQNPIAWYIGKPEIKPVTFEGWTGKVSQGASTNFNDIYFNPHGHGTHTECLGHITRDFYSINQSLKTFLFLAEVISVVPEKIEEDLVITPSQLQAALSGKTAEAVIIRTLPNSDLKKQQKYSNTNWPYLSQAAAMYLREIGIAHLLIDLPSVDKEHDEGKLMAHKAFWNVTNVQELNPDARLQATITEMIFVPDTISDGLYLLNLQIASFENDASPSKPVLYKISEI